MARAIASVDNSTNRVSLWAMARESSRSFRAFEGGPLPLIGGARRAAVKCGSFDSSTQEFTDAPPFFRQCSSCQELRVIEAAVGGRSRCDRFGAVFDPFSTVYRGS